MRSKTAIISGDENISSLQVESILYQHSGILEASVVARPDLQTPDTQREKFHSLRMKYYTLLSKRVATLHGTSACGVWSLTENCNWEDPEAHTSDESLGVG